MWFERGVKEAICKPLHPPCATIYIMQLQHAYQNIQENQNTK